MRINKKTFKTKIKEFFQIQKNWNELEADILLDLEITKEERHNWKSYYIDNINIKENTIDLTTENNKISTVRIDNFTLRNLRKGINETQFKNKYGSNYKYEIFYWTFSYSKTELPHFYFILKTKLNTDSQTTKKRKECIINIKLNALSFL